MKKTTLLVGLCMVGARIDLCTKIKSKEQYPDGQ